MSGKPNNHAAACALAGQGFYVFPLKPGSKSQPLIENWQHKATCDAPIVDGWWDRWPEAGIACVPGKSGFLVLDLDVKNGKDGVAELEKLERIHGELPKTRTHSTPSGGFHLWFKGAVPSSVDRIGRGIDVRSNGGYVVMPPTVIDTGPYTATDDAPIADAQQWLIALATKPKVEVREAVSEDIEFDSPENEARALIFLRNHIPAIQGQGGDNWAYKLFAALRDLRISRPRAIELVEESGLNDRCIPPWTREELETKASNASAYGQNAAGCDGVPTAREMYDPVLPGLMKDAAPERSSALLKPTPFSDVLSRPTAPVEELVPGLIEKGTVTFLSAAGGMNKSRTANQWGLCLATGTPIFGREVERAHYVYLSYEDHADEVARRSQAIARRLQLSRDCSADFFDLSGQDAPLAIIDEVSGCATTERYDAFRDYLKEQPLHTFVVIDSTYNAMRFVGSAKINEGAVMGGISLLQRLCDETNSTILCLWHPSQAGQERGDASGWSVAWHNAPRARLSLSPVKDVDNAFELRVEKRNHGPKGKPITLYWSDGALLPRTAIDTTQQSAAIEAAVVRVALMAAEVGAPLQQQKNLAKWQIDEIEKAIGRRPTSREVKEVLAAQLPAGTLRYVRGSQHRMAGYYPADENRAAELAHEAKRQRGQNA